MGLRDAGVPDFICPYPSCRMWRVGAPTSQTLPVTFPTATLMKPVRQALNCCTVERENPGSGSKSFGSEWSHQDVQGRPSGKFSTCSQLRGKGKSSSSHVSQTGVRGGAPAGQRCWDSHGLSSERYLFIQSVVKQILHPESRLRAGVRGLGCFFTFLGVRHWRRGSRNVCAGGRREGRDKRKGEGGGRGWGLSPASKPCAG